MSFCEDIGIFSGRGRCLAPLILRLSVHLMSRNKNTADSPVLTDAIKILPLLTYAGKHGYVSRAEGNLLT